MSVALPNRKFKMYATGPYWAVDRRDLVLYDGTLIVEWGYVETDKEPERYIIPTRWRSR